MAQLSLKSSVFFGRSEDGAVFRGGGAPVMLRGKKAYELARVIIQGLDQGIALPTLLGKFPDPVRPVAAKLVQDLDDNELLRHRNDDDPVWELGLERRFANLWSFVADNCDKPGSVMQSWQSRNIVLSGDPKSVVYMIRALAETAAQSISLRGAAAEALIDPAFADALSELRSRFPELTISDALHSAPTDALTVHIAGNNEDIGDLPSSSETWFVGRICGQLAVGLLNERPQVTLDRWRSSIRPLEGALAQTPIPDQRIALAAAATAFAALGREAGLAIPLASGRLHVVDGNSGFEPLTLSAQPEIGEAIPGAASTEGSAAPRNDEEEADAFLEDEALFHPITGIVEAIDEDCPQVPFSVVKLRVFSALDRSPLGEVRGWGFTGHEARERAIQKALLAYCASTPSLEGKAGALGSGTTAQAAAANAKATAGYNDATVSFSPVPADGFADPTLHKLHQLLGLLVDKDIQVLAGSDAAGTVHVAKVLIAGSILAQVCSGSPQAALLEALGDACVSHVLGPMDKTAANDLGLQLTGSEPFDETLPRLIDFDFGAIAKRYAIVWAGETA
ncbi:MAG: hypothetical protein AAGK01_04955 [Pseudomonadota bacterium]